MKIRNIAAAAALVVAASSQADVRVIIPEGDNLKSIVMESALISDLATARNRNSVEFSTDSATFDSRVATLPLDSRGAAKYVIPFGDEAVEFYASPTDTIDINIISADPFAYEIMGSELMAGVQTLRAAALPIENRYAQLSANGTPEASQVESLLEEYRDIFRRFIKSNPNSPAAPFALMQLEGEEFLDTYKSLENIEKSILFPYLQSAYTRTEKRVAQERAQKELVGGHMDAPQFTLTDLDGKQVSLSDFKGKWVVIDFWGSWCIWCIKGFPALKEAYAQYAPSLEVIGVDCGETEQAWRAGVEKYKLPWVNVYNPSDSGLTDKYQVQGFPTKAIVNPEGKLVDITTGEDPTFFDRLASFITNSK